MSEVAIRVEGLGKQYRIGRTKRSHDTLRDQISDFGVSIFDLRKRLNGRNHGAATSNLESAGEDGQSADTIWALKDVSFEVGRGEVVGIIGRNGAGKSTLLKILSRITEPTTGTVDLFGRVGSLLEVGTGFHPELTGRENIFLNGAILGMRRAEIASKFDEIVAFAEVEKFIDTPVKRYSSGMYVRLAFAVAAHLEPEILLVDEVLAVGDAAFQKKCLGKMGDVAREGRTVLFVSHNMAAVQNISHSGLLIVDGTVSCRAPIDICVMQYVAENSPNANIWIRHTRSRKPLEVESVEAEIKNHNSEKTLEICLLVASNFTHKSAFVAVDISDSMGTPLMQAIPALEPFIDCINSRHHIKISVSLPPLIPGQYFVSVWAGSHNTETLDQIERCVSFQIVESPTAGRSFPHTRDHGWVVPHSQFEYEPIVLQR